MGHSDADKPKRAPGHRRDDGGGGIARSLVLITQFGIEMLTPILLCTFLGIWIDRRAKTSFWVVILFFVGALAGFTNIYRLVRRAGGTDDGRGKRKDRADTGAAPGCGGGDKEKTDGM